VIPASRAKVFSTLTDYQTDLVLKIYQGEARLVKDNIYLGKLSVPLRGDKAGKQGVDVRFTYDTSGLLEVEATVVSTGLKRSLVIENQPGVLDAAEIAQRLKKLEGLKVNPAEQAENVALIARAERVYGERLGPEREAVGAQLDAFLLVLNRQDPAEIADARAALSAWLDGVDLSVF
jgi:molecular chaperone HscC